MKKRLLAAIMSLCMVVSLLPVSAFAAGDEGEVTATKTWEQEGDEKSNTFEITLSVQGNPITTTTESAADVVLVVDNSGSMSSSVGEPCNTPKDKFESSTGFRLWNTYTCPKCGATYTSSLLGLLWDTRPDYCTGEIGAEPRIDTAKAVSKAFAEDLLTDGDNQMAVIGFAHGEEGSIFSDGYSPIRVSQKLTDDLDSINSAIDEMGADGGTDYTSALQQAYDWLDGRSLADKENRPAYVVFISDGAPGYSGESVGNPDWNGSEQAADLKRDGVTVYTIGIALSDSDSRYLESLASDPTSEHYLNVTGTNYAEELEKILIEWAEKINSIPAGKNAVMTDVINSDYFELVPGSLSDGLEIDPDDPTGNTLVWDIGNIPESGQVSFQITVKDEVLPEISADGDKVLTNDGVTLIYDSNLPGGGSVELDEDDIGKPEVTIYGEKQQGGGELTAEDVRVYKEPVTSSSKEMDDPADKVLTAGTDYAAAVRQDDGTYLISTAADSATVLYEVRVMANSNTAGGSITVTENNENAVYQGARLNNATVTDNSNGTYTVTFAGGGNGSEWAYLYFTVPVNDIPADGEMTVNNSVTFGGETETSPDVTILQGETYRVTYEQEGVWWPYGEPIPTDKNLYKEGDQVEVSDQYYVGQTIDRNRLYVFQGWDVKFPATGVTIDENNQFVMPASDVTLAGTWDSWQDPSGKAITVKVVNGTATIGNDTVDNDVETFFYSVGNSVTINFTPDSGYMLGTVVVDGKQVAEGLDEGNTYTFDNIQDHHGIVVYFVEDTNEYTLTYDGNGTNVTNVPDPETVKAGTHNLSATVPSYGDYVFIGWTLDDSAEDVVYEAGQQLPETTETVKMEKDTTVYAVWGEDTNGDKVADATQVLITPAKITIYEGGEGYDYALGDADADPSTDGGKTDGLPEPGYYIVLPWQVNKDLKEDYPGDIDDNGVVNLANHLVFSYNSGTDTREWHLATYDPDGNSRLSNGRYIYRILPATADTDGDGVEESIPVRLVFTDESGNETLDDDFTFSANDLYAKFQMTIYDGGLDQTQIQVKVDGTDAVQDVGIGTGELVIRGTTGDADTVAVNDMENDADGFTVTADAGNVYYVNGSPIQVQESDIHLLVDDLAMEEDSETEKAMQDAADKAIDTALDNPQYEFKYLDLVDYNNGNAYVTLRGGDQVTVNWPMPANADPDTIHVVHFDGLDREFDISELDKLLNSDEVTAIVYSMEDGLTVGTDSVSFNTSTFSPFVLVYETKAEQPDPTPDPDPGNGNSGSDNDNDSDPTGNLSIELDVNGGDDDFTFTVILTDRNGDDLENNFYYNGDYTGTIGSGDEITLEGGEKIVIRNLPEGTRYEVIIETADGYTYVIDGEEGVIHTGMNEAEFTATRTVPVADPSVTGVSRWLNTTDHIAYLTGYPGGTFGPDNNMTRAEVAQMFYALLNNKNVTITKTFPDVPADAWYATAVNTLASLGMVSGDENGNYRPDDPITRAEFCVIALAFAYEPENAVCYFGDVSRSDWFYTYVAQAASYGWIGGYTNGNFGPNDRITRAQVTTIVNNMLGRAADRDYVIDHQADLVQFSDLTRAHWGYFQIMEATNAHDYTKSNGTENWR